jgi:hypothetical protein
MGGVMQIPPRQRQHRPPAPDSAEARRAEELAQHINGAQACRAVETAGRAAILAALDVRLRDGQPSR